MSCITQNLRVTFNAYSSRPTCCTATSSISPQTGVSIAEAAQFFKRSFQLVKSYTHICNRYAVNFNGKVILFCEH